MSFYAKCVVKHKNTYCKQIKIIVLLHRNQKHYFYHNLFCTLKTD